MTVAVWLLNRKNAAKTAFRAKTPRILVNSLPKSGTNLVVSLAEAYGRVRVSGPVITPCGAAHDFAGRDGLVFGHMETLEDGAADGFDHRFLIIRQPSDYIRSLARYITSNPRHPLYGVMKEQSGKALLTVIIEGKTGDWTLAPVDVRYAGYVATARQHGMTVVDFDAIREGEAMPLLKAIGGADYAATFPEMLRRSQRTSATYRHAQRGARDDLDLAGFADHPRLVAAETVYADAFRHSA